MKLYLNGEAIVTNSIYLADLLKEKQIDAGCVASAVNGEFVPRSRYQDIVLEENMKIEVVAPMQGG